MARYRVYLKNLGYDLLTADRRRVAEFLTLNEAQAAALVAGWGAYAWDVDDPRGPRFPIGADGWPAAHLR